MNRTNTKTEELILEYKTETVLLKRNMKYILN